MKVSQEIVSKVEDDLLHAIRTADTESLNVLLDDRLTFILPTGDSIDKPADLSNYKAGVMKVSSIELVDREILIKDPVAIVTTKIALIGTFGSDRIDGTYKYLRIWHAASDQLKVLAGSVHKLG